MGPRLDLVVGCNGAGKSSLVETILGPTLPSSVFVNADAIARANWAHDAESRSYEAAKIAADTRDKLIRERRSFIAETVFSHPSKLDLIDSARSQGFTVVLYAVMIPEELAVHRVASRIAAGGHSVPEEKIRSRYHRLWPLVAEAVMRSDRGFLFDNSGFEMKQVAQFIDGARADGGFLPLWTPEPLTRLF